MIYRNGPNETANFESIINVNKPRCSMISSSLPYSGDATLAAWLVPAFCICCCRARKWYCNAYKLDALFSGWFSAGGLGWHSGGLNPIGPPVTLGFHLLVGRLEDDGRSPSSAELCVASCGAQPAVVSGLKLSTWHLFTFTDWVSREDVCNADNLVPTCTAAGSVTATCWLRGATRGFPEPGKTTVPREVDLGFLADPSSSGIAIVIWRGCKCNTDVLYET